MQCIPLKSRYIEPGSDLPEALESALSANGQQLKEGDILIVASKVVAYAEDRLVHIKDKKAFKYLIRKEADKVLDEGDMVITLKNKILIPNAGIDNSNTPEGYVVLWPKHPFESAYGFYKKIKKKFALKKLGVVFSDSHCQPLRMGTSGIAIAWAGFEGVQDERGKKDLFGKKLKYTKMAMADNLASTANLLMGEANAGVPFVIVRGFEAEFTDRKFSEKDYFIHPKKCIYSCFYSDELF